MIKENEIWWDSTTLKSYIDKAMIPCGLRIKIIATTLYSDAFKEESKEIE